MALICIGVINLVFVFLSMLKGLQRGLHWQKVFAIACVIQFIIEIVFYQTTECITIHYIIPSSVHNQMKMAFITLIAVIKSLLYPIKPKDTNNVTDVFDATRYFFISNHIARAYPTLIESKLVLTYQSKYPPASFIYDNKQQQSTVWNSIQHMSFISIVMFLIQRLGAMPMSVQRLIVHTIQPLVIAGICQFWTLLMTLPWLSIPTVLGICGIGYWFYRKVQNSMGIIPVNDNMNQDEEVESNNTPPVPLCVPVPVPEPETDPVPMVATLEDNQLDSSEDLSLYCQNAIYNLINEVEFPDILNNIDDEVDEWINGSHKNDIDLEEQSLEEKVENISYDDDEEEEIAEYFRNLPFIQTLKEMNGL